MSLFNKKEETPEVVTSAHKGKIEIFKGINKQFYFRIIAGNGEIVAVSEAYKQKKMCKKGIESVRENVNSEIVDLTL